MTIEIRLADAEELPEAVVLSQKFVRALPQYQHIPFDPVSADGTLTLCLEQGLLFLAFDAEKDEPPMGFVCGMIAPVSFNHQYMQGVEMAWWVNREYRRAGVGRRLHKTIEEAAHELGASQWSMVVTSNSPPDAAHILEQDGYVETEHTWTKVWKD